MPIYLFKCDVCGNIFEELRAISEMSNIADCPKCGCRNSKRQLPKNFYNLISRENNKEKVKELPSVFKPMISNVRIEGFEKGMVVENTKLTGKNIRIKKSKKALEARNSDIEIENLDIER